MSSAMNLVLSLINLLSAYAVRCGEIKIDLDAKALEIILYLH